MKHLTPIDKSKICQLLSTAIIAFQMEENFEAYNCIKLAMDMMEE